ncbi:MAG: hypothetical protein JKY93_08530 [Gammaproteobacteria bacterium]|nr:hypothetical protein [Gammaproteobacteria bacterium]
MNNFLKITADLDDDGTVGLTGAVSNDGFSGIGEAWFNVSDVRLFISKLEHFAKTTENPPELSGGNWDGNGNLIHTLFSLRFYSFSSYRAGVQVQLANHPYTDCRAEEISQVILELKPETQAILNFCKQLNALLVDNINEAYLAC